jgi:cytidylate kinase
MRLAEKLYNSKNKIVIALDGPSASGKGTIGSMLAQEFSLVYAQSSLVYRGLAYICMQKNIAPEDRNSVIKLSENTDILSVIEGIDLNTEMIGNFASKISVYEEVRSNLGKYLQRLIKNTPRIIMEGRDIGTVVAPDADLKIFINADVKVRAERRYKQLRSEGKDCMLERVLELLKERDLRDTARDVAPLKAANDAFIIDTTNLSPAEIIQNIKNFVGE